MVQAAVAACYAHRADLRMHDPDLATGRWVGTRMIYACSDSLSADT